MDHNLPVTLGLWLAGVAPLALLLVLLVVLRWKAPEAGAIGFFLAAGIAWVLFQAPFENLAVASAKGIWDAFFVLLVVWTAILLYHVTKAARGFDAIRIGIQEHTRNMLLLVLAFGWIFASFLQGIAGFGAPIAIVAPLLVALGVRPVMAVVIPLIGHAWANLFGTLAVAWQANLLVTDLENPGLTALYSALMLWPTNLLAGLAICWIYARWEGIKEGIWAVLAVSLVHGGGQAVLTQVDPTLSNFIPSTAAMILLFGLTRWERYREKGIEDSPIMEEGAHEVEHEEEPMSLHAALLPYYVLTLLAIATLAVPPVREFLERFDYGFAFPAVETGYEVVREAEAEYQPIEFLTHPGMYLLLAALFGFVWFKAKGHYEDGVLGRIGRGWLKDSVPASLAVVGFMAMSRVMDHSGQTTVLALGVADFAPPVAYAFFANVIGMLGSFMTSSNTASNVLFTPLQQQTALALEGLGEAEVVASQSAGAAVGNAISPANAVLGTSTAGIGGRVGEVLRHTLVYAAICAVLLGTMGVVFYYAT
jgi:lactate permease